MPANLFLRDQLLAPVPEEALAGIVALAADLGYCTHFDEPRGNLYVDSPLRSRLVACKAEAPPPLTVLAGEILTDLIRRIQAAGGLATCPGRSATAAAASVYMHLEPAADGARDGFALEVCHGWLPGARRLGACIAACLGASTGLTVGVFGRGRLLPGAVIDVYLRAPAEALQPDWAQTVAEGVWLGLMRGLRRSWGLRPAHAARALIPARPAPEPPPAPAPVPCDPVPCPPVPPPPPAVPRRAPPVPLYTWNWSISSSHWELVHSRAAVSNCALEPDDPTAVSASPAAQAGATDTAEGAAPFPPLPAPAAAEPEAQQTADQDTAACSDGPT